MEQGSILGDEATRDLIRRALDEDVGEGDATTQALALDSRPAAGVLVAAGWGVMAGMPVAELVFGTMDPTVRLDALKDEGAEFHEQEILARARGPAGSLLTAERVALNFLQRMCGIASLTRLYVKRLRGTAVVILDTRKTTPGLRALEKYAVRTGGGRNHRLGLDDMVLIKDNHLSLAGSVGACITSARTRWPTKKIEVEVASLDQVDEAVAAAPDRVMLDNMSVGDIAAAVARIRQMNADVQIEASGGVTLASVRQIAETGVDFISVGALTHSAPACDISFEIEAEG